MTLIIIIILLVLLLGGGGGYYGRRAGWGGPHYGGGLLGLILIILLLLWLTGALGGPGRGQRIDYTPLEGGSPAGRTTSADPSFAASNSLDFPLGMLRDCQLSPA